MDYIKAYGYFQKTFALGDSEGVYSAAYMYYKGLGRMQNYKLAAKRFPQASYAKRDNNIYFFGHCWRKGYVVSQIEDSTLYWMDKSAALGYQQIIAELKMPTLDATLNNNAGYSDVTYYIPKGKDSLPYFRFEGDFSNSFRQNYNINNNINNNYANAPFDASPQYGNEDGNTGYNGGNRLEGSKHIDVGLKIYPSNCPGYDSSGAHTGPSGGIVDSHQIKGFSITNESGVTYNYGLPAYSYGEEAYQEKVGTKETGHLSMNRQTKTQAYAYTWYLTTITGPDYVDRNNDHIADAGDWGYWVNFEYGKWSNDYVWRNPSEGFHRDEDNDFQNCSMGHKEVYYLNAIRTRSHIALFEKSIRKDGKGSSPTVFDKYSSNAYANNGIFDSNSAQSLRLDKIYLLNIADAAIVHPNSGGIGSSRTQDLVNNVLDNSDIDAIGRGNIEAKAIRVIDFNYDYSLCLGTANSYNLGSPMFKYGKLTLLNVVTRGKGGANLLPPTTFDYGLPENQIIRGNATITAIANSNQSSLTTSNNNFKVGDLLETDESFPSFCGVITDSISPGVYKVANNSSGYGTKNIRTTKNPPYNKDAYDQWGLYKSDYSSIIATENKIVAKMTTPTSSRAADVWNLRQVTSPLGSVVKIQYESGTYSKVILPSNMPFTTSSVLNDSAFAANAQNHKIKFKVNGYGYNVMDFFKVNGVGKILLAYNSSGLPLTPEYLDFVESDYLITSIDADTTIHATLTNQGYGTEGIYNSIYTHSPNASYIVRGGNISPTVGAVNNMFGEIRTRTISTEDANEKISSTTYDYSNTDNQNLSSGVISYDPQGISVSGYSLAGTDNYSENAYKRYRNALSKFSDEVYSLARVFPVPEIMYEDVSITNTIQAGVDAIPLQIEGKTLYQFTVLRDNMVGRVADPPHRSNISTSIYSVDSASVANITTKIYTQSIGAVKHIIQYDNKGHKLSETINHYLDEGLESLPFEQFMDQYKERLSIYNYQGFLQERLAEAKSIIFYKNYIANYPTHSFEDYTMSAREEYPSIQTGTTVINYVNGTKTTTENIGFDFYSGAVTKTVATDAYGNRVITEVVPAYRKYPSMGLKVSNAANKNMLSQSAGTYVYKVDSDTNKLGLISASVNTWSDLIPSLDINGALVTQNNSTNGDVWRPQYTYSWMEDGHTDAGLTPIANFTDFWTNPSNPGANWVKTSAITSYDVYSKALEGIDINGNYATTHMNYNSMKVEASGTAAKYGEIAFSGAEDGSITQTANPWAVKSGNGIVVNDSSNAHTGVKSLKISAGGKGFVYSIGTNNLTVGRSYLAYAWVKPVSDTSSNAQLYYSIGGTQKGVSLRSGVSTRKAGAWTLLTLLIKGSDIAAGQTLEVGLRNISGADVFGDDFRFQPQDGSSTAYVYDPFSGELKYILDANDLYTRYDYDGVGRLISTYREKLGVGVYKTGETIYNDGAALGASAPIIKIYLSNASSSTNSNIYLLLDGVQYNFPAAGTSNVLTASIPAGSHTLKFSCGPVFDYSASYGVYYYCGATQNPVTVQLNMDATFTAGSVEYAPATSYTVNIAGDATPTSSMCVTGSIYTLQVFSHTTSFTSGMKLFYDQKLSQPITDKKWLRYINGGGNSVNTSSIYQIYNTGIVGSAVTACPSPIYPAQ
ncbi:hypothetical protein [Arachidicoccus sp.]|uniref:hypothetical protein n=1 Tax=Arachidicoccus sp. TaxID=1872624 RepID=UPI003D213E92